MLYRVFFIKPGLDSVSYCGLMNVVFTLYGNIMYRLINLVTLTLFNINKMYGLINVLTLTSLYTNII